MIHVRNWGIALSLAIRIRSRATRVASAIESIIRENWRRGQLHGGIFGHHAVNRQCVTDSLLSSSNLQLRLLILSHGQQAIVLVHQKTIVFLQLCGCRICNLIRLQKFQCGCFYLFHFLRQFSVLSFQFLVFSCQRIALRLASIVAVRPFGFGGPCGLGFRLTLSQFGNWGGLHLSEAR